MPKFSDGIALAVQAVASLDVAGIARLCDRSFDRRRWNCRLRSGLRCHRRQRSLMGHHPIGKRNSNMLGSSGKLPRSIVAYMRFASNLKWSVKHSVGLKHTDVIKVTLASRA